MNELSLALPLLATLKYPLKQMLPKLFFYVKLFLSDFFYTLKQCTKTVFSK